MLEDVRPPTGDATLQPGFNRIRNGHRGEEGVIASNLLSITPRWKSRGCSTRSPIIVVFEGQRARPCPIGTAGTILHSSCSISYPHGGQSAFRLGRVRPKHKPRFCVFCLSFPAAVRPRSLRSGIWGATSVRVARAGDISGWGIKPHCQLSMKLVRMWSVQAR